MIKVCSRNMCAGTGWGWRWEGGCGDLLFGCIVAELRERREESLQLQTDERDVARVVASSASCCGESAARSVCSGRSQSVSRAPQFKEEVRVCVCTSITALARCIGGCFPAASPPPCVRESGLLQRRRPKAIFTKKLHRRCYQFDMFCRGSVEAHSGILCFQCGIHNHNPRFTPEADPLLYGCTPSVRCRTA